jgi:hypothetical protein
VVQGDTDEIERQFEISPEEWIVQQVDAHKEECPDGWDTLVCWGDHPAMMLAPLSDKESCSE